VSSVRLPLVASILGHAGVLALLALFAAQLTPASLPQPQKRGIEVMLMPPLQPAAEAPQPTPEPPPVAETEPPPPEPPPPPAVIPKPEPPPPPPKPVVHKPIAKPPPHRPPPQPVRDIPREPVPRQPMPAPMPRAMPQMAPVQTAAMPRIPMPAPVPRSAPVVSPSYRAMLSAWLESHKRYPESARERGEEGRATLRFRVDRSGRVLNYAVASSTGYPDLDAAIDAMMRGALLPPFPADMTASDVEVSVTVHFSLTR
jgi:protein TonB